LGTLRHWMRLCSTLANDNMLVGLCIDYHDSVRNLEESFHWEFKRCEHFKDIN
jgi:hypothetical protein